MIRFLLGIIFVLPQALYAQVPKLMLKIKAQDTTIIEMPNARDMVYAGKDMPHFNGDIQQFIKAHIKYPADAKARKKQGTVRLRFTVNDRGWVMDASAVRSVFPSLDAEALRVVRSLPDWEPGEQDDTLTWVVFELPVVFKL
ncbi:MAG: energy transducer TonB [Bacteroidetes bacterium]|nr:energy transducer TonB [Bacteroidota bacterium]